MKRPQPKLVVLNAGPVTVGPRESALNAARRRFGQKFAHEPGSTWKPRTTPVLIEWLGNRKREQS